MAISELNEYISNLKAKHGKLREFPPKTCFDATKNFDLDKIFVDPSGEGKLPCEYFFIKIVGGKSKEAKPLFLSR